MHLIFGLVVEAGKIGNASDGTVVNLRKQLFGFVRRADGNPNHRRAVKAGDDEDYAENQKSGKVTCGTENYHRNSANEHKGKHDRKRNHDFSDFFYFGNFIHSCLETGFFKL